MILTDKEIDEILNYLDTSLANLAKDTMNNNEFQMNNNDLKQFLFAQYDIRLDNLLQKKNSGIHHLESKMKNKTIQRKQKLFEDLWREFKI